MKLCTFLGRGWATQLNDRDRVLNDTDGSTFLMILPLSLSLSLSLSFTFSHKK